MAALQEAEPGGPGAPGVARRVPRAVLVLLPGAARLPAGPDAAAAARLGAAFDTLFATRTGYGALDERIAKTAAKEQALLRALEKPALPLTNNPAELGPRRRVRKRDARFGARSAAGIAAWDTFHTMIGTAQLLGVNVLHYLQDRCSGACRIPPLADLIRQRATIPAALPAAA